MLARESNEKEARRVRRVLRARSARRVRSVRPHVPLRSRRAASGRVSDLSRAHRAPPHRVRLSVRKRGKKRFFLRRRDSCHVTGVLKRKMVHHVPAEPANFGEP